MGEIKKVECFEYLGRFFAALEEAQDVKRTNIIRDAISHAHLATYVFNEYKTVRKVVLEIEKILEIEGLGIVED